MMPAVRYQASLCGPVLPELFPVRLTHIFDGAVHAKVAFLDPYGTLTDALYVYV